MRSRGGGPLLVVLLLTLLGSGMAWGRTITDRNITQAVERQLRVEPSISAHLIDVQTQKGVVTLTGTVDTLLAKRHSVQVAESVKGVRSVVNRLRVRPVAREDNEIRFDVQQALAKDPATESYEVHVSVDDGVVTLEGRVESYPERMLSEKVAMSVKGVKDVENKLIIAAGTSRPDAQIQAEIARRLEFDPYIEENYVKVDVADGIVTFTGSVGSAWEKSRLAAKGWVRRVTDVHADKVAVDAWLREEMKRRPSETRQKPPKKIERAMADAFLYDPRVLSFDVEADVRGSVAVLRGTVDNLKAKRAAEQDARHTAGVSYVINRIKVRTDEAPDDEQIAEEVRAALTRDAVVERHEITVLVRNRKVYLYGAVDNLYEKMRAETVAEGVRGVADIQNNLTVDTTWTWKDDAQIEDDIRDELFWSPWVDSEDIHVFVEDGTATLTGSVDSWLEFDAVMHNAFEGGAAEVKSYIEGEGIQLPDYRRPIDSWPL